MLKMHWPFFFVLVSPLTIASFPAPSDSAAEQAQARVYLKQRLMQLNLEYPFSDWVQRLETFNDDVNGFLDRHAPMRYDPSSQPEFLRLAAELDTLRALRPKVQTLIHEMYVQIMVGHVEDLFQRDGKPFSPQGRDAFYRTLKPYEAGSLRPKTDYLAQLVSEDQKFTHAYSSWEFEWAGAMFPRIIAAQSQDTGFAAEEAARQDLALKLTYWSRQIDSGGAAQAADQLLELQTDLRGQRPRAISVLREMESNLDPDMLLSDLLEAAQKDGLSFTVEAEERIEAALDARGQSIQSPIQQKIDAWMDLEPDLRGALARAQATVGQERQAEAMRATEAKRQQQQLAAQSQAQAEQDRMEQRRQAEEAREHEEQVSREQAREAALAAEQQQAEATQREQVEQTLADWKNLQSGGALADLDSATHNALDIKAGALKTSVVGSGRTRLRVESAKFSDTLAFVEKFTVAESHIDLSKLSLDQKATQSAYVYTSPSGRTNPRDLDQFVQNVALGSFHTEYRFLSYLAPEHVRYGRSLSWTPDRSSEPEAKDRTFSYVDLVDAAHHKTARNTATSAEGAQVNLPANLIVFFDANGGILRYQSFAGLGQIFIRPQDLVEGRLHYKFLNYSVDRENVYLNGIDPEIKISSPTSG